MHRIPLELIAVIACPHVGLLASKLGGKASTNLGAPHTAYPDSLQPEIDAYLKRLSHHDLLADDGPDKPLKETSLRNIRAHLRQTLEALVEAGCRPEQFQPLADLVTPQYLRKALQATMDRLGVTTPPSWFGNIAATFIAIAKYQISMNAEDLATLQKLHKRVAANPRGMSSKNSERLAQFNTWDNISLLVGLPDALMARALAQPALSSSAREAMHAAALAILLSCPMRIKNLAALDMDKDLIPTRRGTHTNYTVRIESIEAKNGEPVEVHVSPQQSRLLQSYLKVFRHRISDVQSTALFPQVSTGAPRISNNLGQEIKQRVKRETGLTVNPHLFRHVSAKLYLNERPGDYETVRRLLQHKRIQTTIDFYAELNNQNA